MLYVSAYLERISYLGQVDPSAETLRGLHLAHMLAVPFENLDIHIGRPIVCDEDRFLHKIINERRGGFCYELNGAFSALLRALGFQVTLLSARVAGADGDTDGPDFDHLTLRVDLPGSTNHGLTAEVPWLADVGFGEGLLETLQMEARVFIHSATARTLRLCRQVPVSPDLARVPLHAPANLLARDSRGARHLIRFEAGRDSRGTARRARTTRRAGLARSSSGIISD